MQERMGESRKHKEKLMKCWFRKGKKEGSAKSKKMILRNFVSYSLIAEKIEKKEKKCI